MVLSDTQKEIVKLRKEITKCKCADKEKQLKSLIEKNKKELADKKKKPKVVIKGKAKLTKEQKEKLKAKKDDPKKVWNTIKDLNWKENVRSKILALFGEGRMGFKNYYIIKSTEIKGNKFIVKYVYTPERAKVLTTGGMALEDEKENEKEYIKLTTKPQTSQFTIPKN